MAKTNTATRATRLAGSPALTRNSAGTKEGRALVFISHDSRDAGLAQSFANLLSDVSAGTLKSFHSSDKTGTSGIEFGTQWYSAIMSQLDEATDVVALLTHHSIDRPWILYEAGVAKGKLDSNVLGIAVGIPLGRVSIGPFGQFQNCGDDEDSLTKLVIQLLRRNPEAAPREEAVRRQVRAFLEGTRTRTLQGSAAAEPASIDESQSAKLYEEIKAMVRELPERFVDRLGATVPRGAVRRAHRFHPMMFEQFLDHEPLVGLSQAPAAVWLVFLSSLRSDLPWFYETGLDLYHALHKGDRQAVLDAHKELSAVLGTILQVPLLRDVLRPDDPQVSLLRTLPELVDAFVQKALTHQAFAKQVRGRAKAMSR
jgi:hypothetical protein